LLADRRFADFRYAAPIFVAKRQVIKQVLHRAEAEGFELCRARRTDAFQKAQRGL